MQKYKTTTVYNMYTPKTMYHRGGKTSQMASVRLKINEHMTSVGEEILCVLDKQQRGGVDVYSVTLNVRVFVLERLSAVGEFICSLFQRQIETLETQLLETQNKLLDVDFMDIYPNTAEVSSGHEEKRRPSVVQEEPQHEERNPSLVQDEPQPPQIKLEEDHDGNESTLTAMCDTLSDSHDGAEEDTAVGKKPKKERQIVQKRRRMMGQSYIGKSKGAEVNNKPRVMGPRCQSAACVKSSKFHCSDIGEADREKIFKCYWENMNWEEKKMYVQGLIDVAPVKRRRGSSQRSCARVFFLNVDGQRRRVCRSLFLSTLGIKAWSAFNWTMDPGTAQKNAASRDRDVLLFPVCKEISSEEERSPGLVQEEPEPPHIKEEQEELLQRPEEVDRPMLTLLAVKSADDDGDNRQTDPVASTSSTEHMKTQAYIKYWVRSQP